MPTLENDLSLTRTASASEEIPQALQAVATGIPKNIARDADAQRKRARTLAKQQRASERAGQPDTEDIDVRASALACEHLALEAAHRDPDADADAGTAPRKPAERIERF